MRLIKTILLSLASLVALLLLTIVAIAILIDPNDYKTELTQLAADQGANLQIQGDLSWSFFPQIGIQAGKLSIQPPATLEISSRLLQPVAFNGMLLTARLMPLLHGDIQVETVQIEGGTLTLLDPTTHSITTIQNLMLSIRGLNLQQIPFDVSLSLDMKETQAGITTQQVKLKSNLTLAVDKTLQFISMSQSQHDISFTAESIGNKTANIRANFPAEINLVTQQATLSNLQLKIDDSQFNGSIDASYGDAPFYKVSLNGDSLNTDRYTATTEKKSGNTASSPDTKKEAELIPAAVLLAFPGSYAFSLKKMQISNLQLSDVETRLDINAQGLLTLHTLKTRLYGGDFSAHGSINAGQAKPIVAIDLSLTPLQLEPALKDYFQTDKAFASGDFGFNGKITSKGMTEEELIQALRGDLIFNSTNISLNQVDLTSSLDASLMQLLQMKLPRLNSRENTSVLTNMLGKATIENGIINNTSLTASATCTRFNGKGQLDLVRSTLDYQMSITFPSADDAKTCLEINSRLKDIAWPVLCKGSLAGDTTKLCNADTAQIKSMITQAAKKETVKKLEKSIDEKLKNKLGDEQGDQVKQLLKGFLH